MQPHDPSQASAPYGQAQQPGAGFGPAGENVAGYPPPGGQAPGMPPQPGMPPGAYQPGYPPQTGTPQPRPRAPRPMLPVTLGDALAAFGGLLVFLFSFAPFVVYSDEQFPHQLGHRVPTWFSAWSTEIFMAPLTWFVVLGGLVVLAASVSRLFLPRDRELLGFRVAHIQIGVALFVFVALFGYGTSGKDGVVGYSYVTGFLSDDVASPTMSFGWGGYLMLFGALVGVAGAILSHLNIGPTLYPLPPKPAMHYPPQQYPGANSPTAVYPTVPPPNAPQSGPPQSGPPQGGPAQGQQYGYQQPSQQYGQEPAAQWQGPQDTTNRWQQP